MTDNVEVVRLLLSHRDIDINRVDSEGATALYIASELGRIETVRLLLSKSKSEIDMNKATKSGATALNIAFQKGHVEVFCLLLSKSEIDINKIMDNGVTALFMASQLGHLEAVRLLLSKSDIDINKAMKDGATALYIASQEDNVKVVRLLLSKSGIDINKADNDGATALHIASQNGHLEVVRLLLCKSEIDINKATNPGSTALFIASQKGHVQIVSLLLSKSGTDINNANDDGVTALLMASQEGHLEVVRLLVSKSDIDINKAADGGFTALWIASDKGHLEVVRLLISKSEIDINKARDTGVTALYVASEKDHVEIVRLLLSKSEIDIDKGEQGWTPLKIAKEQGHGRIVKLIKVHQGHGKIALSQVNEPSMATSSAHSGNYVIRMGNHRGKVVQASGGMHRGTWKTRYTKQNTWTCCHSPDKSSKICKRNKWRKWNCCDEESHFRVNHADTANTTCTANAWKAWTCCQLKDSSATICGIDIQKGLQIARDNGFVIGMSVSLLLNGTTEAIYGKITEINPDGMISIKQANGVISCYSASHLRQWVNAKSKKMPFVSKQSLTRNTKQKQSKKMNGKQSLTRNTKQKQTFGDRFLRGTSITHCKCEQMKSACRKCNPSNSQGYQDPAQSLTRNTNKKLKVINVVPWQLDADVSECYQCRKTFNMLRRKHHCRACGMIFCNACTKSQMLTSYQQKIGSDKPQRVCDNCKSILLSEQAAMQLSWKNASTSSQGETKTSSESH
jgi:ankyrin repeat protein